MEEIPRVGVEAAVRASTALRTVVGNSSPAWSSISATKKRFRR